MGDLIAHLADQPIANLIALGGMVFLFVAAVGKIPGMVEADSRGRVFCGMAGFLLLLSGVGIHWREDPRAPAGAAAAGQQQPAAKSDLPIRELAARSRPDACQPGYVWREAFPHDHVCVTPEIRRLTKEDNQQAAARRDPAGGPFGPDTCLAPYVWRAASPDDHVCVSADMRDQAARDNAAAGSRQAH